MDYDDQLAALRAADPALGNEIAGLRNLEAILKWGTATGVPFADLDLIQQDEYSYDFFVPVPGARWLVFAVS